MTRSTLSPKRRALAAVAGGASLALVLTACGGSGGDDETGGSTGEAASIDCAPYEEFGDIDGTSVNVYTSIVDPEAQTQKDSYKPFEDCTGVTIDYEGSREFEAQLLVRVKAGNAPDIAYLPQPGLLQTIVRDTGTIVPAPDATATNVDENWEASWKEYGTVDGVFYAAPLGANVKSYVWYSPAAFEDGGYEVPETWDDLMTLSKQYSEDNDGALPWCAGVESGDATGWPGTDFVEDMMLRTAGPDVYDQWYKHEIPFNDPQVVTAFDTAGEVLKDPAMVNAGLGGVDSIATTPWTDAGFGLLDGTCFLHRAANFYQTQFPEGTDVSEEGEVFAFYLPTNQTDIKPVEVGGEFVAAFNDRPEVQAFQTYLSSAEWANAKAKATPDGGWVSANKGLDPENLSTEFDKLSAEILADPKTVSRFDASDLMPGAVGAGTFWTGIVNWLTGASTQEVVDQIEASWPTS
ncbi:carbohydrate ABC transporter substrate-binding protein [Oerskovia turbata]|uniref:Carbohydrate ABC transporter substrate-binding protein n=1 Tax=Oerskovia turbata TaxID=1713 RepID=A0A4Q1KT19_9CELL|nr:ABC transporter substrate-binding protein [Oerskovia turbata]RXR25767.1 carbohydrate ABC transporter substrate-binding protein [Oerskovia turbata]RXR33333.1 carbohydrate ABC transporter substrate-binding protein [Oerskovia turbata]TGJ96210.1 carbohydrate ABC transporter substrate-binding protein [Actinotalea fermentans ATCC 43279 = JCM 9966 = DSM 3133]